MIHNASRELHKKVHFVLGEGVYPHRVGGMEVFNYYIIKELMDSVDVYYSAYYPLPFENVRFFKMLHLRPVKFFAPVQTFLFHLKNRSVRNIVFSYSAAHWLVWRQYAWIVRLFHLNAVVIIHYGWHPDGSEKPERIRSFFKYAKTVVAVSNDIKTNYDLLYNICCRVIPPLVPFPQSSFNLYEARQHYGIPQDAFVVAMVGSLKAMKNPQTLLECFAQFSPEEKNIIKPHIVYAGNGVMLTSLEKYAGDQGLSEAVTFLGNVPKDHVCDVMSLTDCYVIASDFEGTSVSVLEAMFNRKPIIFADSPGLKDMLQDGVTGSAFCCKDSTSLKKALIDLYQHPDKGRNMAEAAYELYQKKYDYSRVVSAYQELFD